MTCPTGKIVYPTPQAAWHAATHLAHRVRTSATKHRHHHAIHAYRCRDCGAWHTSGTPKPRRTA